MFSMVRASQGVLAKHVWPGRRHSSSEAEGHHWRVVQVSVWMSAKEEPQKNLYLILSVEMAPHVVVADRRRIARRADSDVIVVYVSLVCTVLLSALG